MMWRKKSRNDETQMSVSGKVTMFWQLQSDNKQNNEEKILVGRFRMREDIVVREVPQTQTMGRTH
jgi:hypothetical protein